MKKLLLLLAFASLSAMICVPRSALAQKFPDRVVRIVVGFTPGGPADSLARSIANGLTKKWGQRVIVENKPGASGIVGAMTVKQAAPDGYTLLLADSSSYVILPHLRRNLPFDPRVDFTPITIVARQAPVLAAREKFPADTVPELITYAKKNPGKVTFGTFGVGTWSHVKMEEFSRLAHIQMLHVPFRGAAPVIDAMLGNRIDLFLGAYGLFETYERAGKIKILATATPKRLPFRPDIPTIAEAGFPGYSVSVWFGIVGPRGMAPSISEKIQRDIASVLADPSYQRKYLDPQRLEAGGEPPSVFKSIIESDYERWGETINKIGLKMTDD